MTQEGAICRPAAAAELRARFERIVRADRELMRLLTLARGLALPQWRIVAGCLYQTVWNALTGRPAGTGVKDFDLIYFDGADLSLQGEDKVIQRVGKCTTGLSRPVEVRNQARVHLWFEARFGIPYAPLRSADEALTRYASVVHAVGVRLEEDGRLDVYAPFGLEDVFGMTIRPNRALPNAATHAAKAARARVVWPEVRVIDWD